MFASTTTTVPRRRFAAGGLLAVAVAIMTHSTTTDAFGVSPILRTHRRYRTGPLYLEDHIANMIDKELDRLSHKHEIDAERRAKEQKWKEMEPTLPSTLSDFNINDVNDDDLIQKRRDTKLAERDPERYCADRCVATGNCDVFEDMFEMSPEEVMEFCNDCVLSEEEEPCPIPDKMLDDADKPSWETRSSLRP